METNEIVELIKKRKDILFRKLKEDQESLDSYIFISNEFKKGNISTNNRFRRKYKEFYRMTAAGLTQAFFDKYFQLLEDGETDLQKILRVLSRIPRRKGDYAVELSFATKLIHTIDNNSPIFDNNVAKVFGLKLKYIKDLDQKIEDRVYTYELLKRKFEMLLKSPEIQEIILDFKEKLGININDVKMLDFILWKLGENLA